MTEPFAPADQAVLAEIAARRPPDGRVVFVSGNFNILHPGHLRLLKFAAECGDMLVIGVNADDIGAVLLPEDLRLQGIESVGIVDFAFILRIRPEAFIAALRPDIVVKGKEYETLVNPERAVLDLYGGKLLFSSGEARFSSLDLLSQELRTTNFSSIVKPADFPARHHFSMGDLTAFLQRCQGLRVVVLGDLIVDEYVNCEALGMSQEDPTLVVTPIRTDSFVGGAGIVAAHARGLGAEVQYFGVVGRDETADFAGTALAGYGVSATLLVDESRPTTLKKRYRAGNKTLLRVSRLRQHDIDTDLADRLAADVIHACRDADLLIFSDFNYGCLPQPVVDRITAACQANGTMLVADSQASSQIADVSRFKQMRLLTPTEREARMALGDMRSGLVVLAEKLCAKASAEQIIMTLGAEGLLIFAPGCQPLFTDRLPALNSAPKDVAGAGDALLTCTAMAMARGADIWQATYLGAVAAACQVGRVGNQPLSIRELAAELAL